MSLQLAAQHLSNQGRGPDDTLVHMSNNEVKSLNDLAMAHGGQLTINPETGLPEAGFLSAILPLVAGAALGPAGFGLTAMQAGLLVGAGAYALNPRGGLMGGLSAGLGGYGGAGLGAGLSDIATSEAGASVQNVANEGAQQEVARQTAQQQAQQAMINASPEAAGFATPSALPTANQLSTIKSNIVNEQLLANPPPTGFDAMYKGAESLVSNPTADKFKTLGGGNYMGLAQKGLAAAAPVASEGLKPDGLNVPKTQQKAQVVPHYKFSPGMVTPTPEASATGVENTYFNPSYTAVSDAEAQQLYPGYPAAQAAGGGLMGYATGGISDAGYNLGGYSDGGRLLRGPGDGVSDSIPAVIGKKQPARLADGEFVVPARIVSELGNGSTEAGARKLYAMMDRIQAARGKTVGKGRVAKNSRSEKYLPA